MAFQNKNLSVIAYASGFTLWHYSEGEPLAIIGAAGYFNAVKSLMNAGDIIIVNGSDATGLRAVTATAPDVAIAELK
jgi:hypothetical protein